MFSSGCRPVPFTGLPAIEDERTCCSKLRAHLAAPPFQLDRGAARRASEPAADRRDHQGQHEGEDEFERHLFNAYCSMLMVIMAITNPRF